MLDQVPRIPGSICWSCLASLWGDVETTGSWETLEADSRVLLCESPKVKGRLSNQCWPVNGTIVPKRIRGTADSKYTPDLSLRWNSERTTRGGNPALSSEQPDHGEKGPLGGRSQAGRNAMSSPSRSSRDTAQAEPGLACQPRACQFCRVRKVSSLYCTSLYRNAD